MSALAHWFEQAGLITVVIGLVKPHLQIMQPPRALWVPFELGRPLGAPGDRDSQTLVLRRALGLIESATEQTLVDFDREDPRATADPDWTPPATGTPTSIVDELAQLASAQAEFARRAGRNSVGVAGVELARCAAIVEQTLADGTPPASDTDSSPLLQFRYACDDLKMAWIEAALANGKPSSRQTLDWFWLDSLLGQSLRKLRQRWLDSGDDKLATVGGRFLVPHRWRV